MNLFKSRVSPEYLRVPLIFINLIRADRSSHILYTNIQLVRIRAWSRIHFSPIFIDPI